MNLKCRVIGFMAFLSLCLLPGIGHALPVGQSLFYYNTASSINPTTSGFSLVHNLGATDFSPQLEGGENVTINSASWMVFLVGIDRNTELAASLDGQLIGVNNFGSAYLPSYVWSMDLLPAAYNNLNDGNGLIDIQVLSGKIGSVQDSVLTGNAAVTPEPVSLLLLGSGLAVLGIKRKKKI